MSPGAFAVIVVTGLIVFTTIERLTYRYASWHPAARATARFADIVHVARGPGESLKAWDTRIEAAHKELSAATDEFFAAIRRGEGTTRQTSVRGFVMELPGDHPVAIRYRKAKGLDKAEGLDKADKAEGLEGGS